MAFRFSGVRRTGITCISLHTLLRKAVSPGVAHLPRSSASEIVGRVWRRMRLGMMDPVTEVVVEGTR